MVDSIHRTGRIAVIAPAGQRHPVERRQESKKEHQRQGGDDSSGTPEESKRTPADNLASDATCENAETSSGNERKSPTGRCIDVRI